MKNLQFETGPPPDNDDCQNAFVTTGDVLVDTTLWVTDGLPEPGLCGPGGNVFRDGWYIFIAECNGLATATLDGDFGTRILVYVGDCDDLIPIACSGDTGCGPENATVSFPAQPGVEYTLRVGACEEGQTGIATLSVSCATVQVPALPPAGMVCLVASLVVAGLFVLSRRKAPVA